MERVNVDCPSIEVIEEMVPAASFGIDVKFVAKCPSALGNPLMHLHHSA